MRTLSSLRLSLCLGLLLFGLFPSHAHSQTSSSASTLKSPLNIVGSYSQGGGYGGPSLKLLPNGQYTLVITSDTENPKESGGDYTLANGLLTLSPRYKVGLVWDQSTQTHIGPTRVAISSPVVRYLAVRCGERAYLLQQGKEELRFCNSINMGDEPVPANLLETHLYLMRKGDEKKAVTGFPQLPAPWNAYLLPRPVKGKILRIQKGALKNFVTINVGNANNIRVGMNFLDNRRNTFFTVIATKPHQATLETFDTSIRTGAIVSTRRTPSIWSRR